MTPKELTDLLLQTINLQSRLGTLLDTDERIPRLLYKTTERYDRIMMAYISIDPEMVEFKENVSLQRCLNDIYYKGAKLIVDNSPPDYLWKGIPSNHYDAIVSIAFTAAYGMFSGECDTRTVIKTALIAVYNLAKE